MRVHSTRKTQFIKRVFDIRILLLSCLVIVLILIIQYNNLYNEQSIVHED